MAPSTNAARDGRHPGRVLVLGAAGMLGHKMFQLLSAELPDVWGAIRGSRRSSPLDRVDLLQSDRILEDFDASDWTSVRPKIVELRPAVVVNCIGVIKQRAAANSAIPSIRINALLPHLLAETMREWDGRLIHISSDCVFSGNRGNYREDDPSDALDLYGRSKFLGEIAIGNVLTLRTSIIGRELQHHESLLDWFLQQNHKSIRGFRRALWSGVTTIHLSKLVAQLITSFPDLRGLYQISTGCLSKHDLLVLLRKAYDLDIRIEPDDTVHCDRSLDGSRLAAAIAYQPPSWDELARELVDDPTPYDRWTRLGRIQ